MTPGCIILARVQQSDGRLKTRPAVILSLLPPFNDLLICGVSSKLRQEVAGFDDLLVTTHPDFAASGLKVDSLIRLGLLATVPATAVIGELGSIPQERLSRLLRRLADHLSMPPPLNRDSMVPEEDLREPEPPPVPPTP